MSIEREDAEAIARDYVHFCDVSESLDDALTRIKQEYEYTDFTDDDLEMIQDEIKKEARNENGYTQL